MTIKRKPGRAKPVKSRSAVRAFHVAEGLPNVTKMMEELQDYTDVLLGRVEPPVKRGTLTLMEIADTYYARAAELTMLLQAGEREGTVIKGSGHYKFRTGELRTFMEMCKRAADLGSRRLTDEALELDRARLGRESG